MDGLHVNETINCLRCQSWVQQMFPMDKDLLVDILTHRPEDVHELFSRLELAVKPAKQVLQQHMADDDNVWQGYTAVMVTAYISCVKTAKLARNIKKLLDPINREEVFKEFEQAVLRYLTDEDSSETIMIKLCYLLEQCDIVRLLVVQHYSQILWFLCRSFDVLLKVPPSALTPNDSLLLYATVKTSLLMFQLFPGQAGISLECLPPSGELQDTITRQLRSTVTYLLIILTSECYPVDSTLLSGTAFAVMLNLMSDTQQAAILFFNGLDVVGQRQEICRVWKNLESKTMPSFLSSSSSLSCSPRIGILFLVQGLISSAKISLLSFSFGEGERKRTVIMETFELICCLCKSDMLLHYHSFQLLQLWYQQYLKIFSELHAQGLLNREEQEFEEKTMELIWLNWDSPVDGVAESVACIFGYICQVWCVEKDLCPRRNREDLHKKLLEKLLAFPWYIKRKYKLLSHIVPFVDTSEIMSQSPELRCHLLKCMSTNHLAPAASTAYLAFVTKLVSSQDSPISKEVWEAWKNDWMDFLIEGLASSNMLLRNNMSQYLLSPTLKAIPDCAAQMVKILIGSLNNGQSDALELNFYQPASAFQTKQVFGAGRRWQRSQLLHVWIIVCQAIRAISGNAELREELLREALYSDDDDLRVTTLSLLCTSAKKTEPFHGIEVRLLLETLPFNMNISSAPFRQSLVVAMKKLLLRVRDSCLHMMKMNCLHNMVVSLNFVEWLHTMCIDNLHPGANFQRRKTCLEILQVVYNTLYHPVKTNHSIEAINKLKSYAREKGLWNFLSPETFYSVTLCVKDGTDEVRSFAADILTRNFDSSFWKKLDTELLCHLLRDALHLCDSPKAPESQAGALLCHLVFQKCIVECGRSFSIQFSGGSYHVSEDPHHQNASAVFSFIRSLLHQVQAGLAAAAEDLVSSSKQKPLHGLIHCIALCLPTCHNAVVPDEHAALLTDVVSVSTRVVDTALSILAGGSKTSPCPSFAEIAIALENLIVDSHSDYQTPVSLSHDHQFLLSWCWINLKETCSLLGCVIALVYAKSRQLVLPRSTTLEISDTFLRVLTNCRHRGAIESCKISFLSFCKTLLAARDPELEIIPETVLKQQANSRVGWVLLISCTGGALLSHFYNGDNLCTLEATLVFSVLRCSDSATSVTRRSAGLPIIIQCICVAEKIIKKHKLLHLSVQTLFEIAWSPLEKTANQKEDLPQVHAYNILKALFEDNCLAADLRIHISQAVMMVMEGFLSTSWAIRNGATQFFSTLMTRIFGQKKTKDGHSQTSISLLEFTSLYPDLLPFILTKLDSCQESIHSIGNIHPALFPVLTLLASLEPQEPTEHLLSIAEKLEQLVGPMLDSPVYHLRELAASAMVVWVAPSSRLTKIRMFMESLDSASVTSHNNLHGCLLLIKKLIQPQEWSQEESRSMLSVFLQKIENVNHHKCCYMIQSQCLQIIGELVKNVENYDYNNVSDWVKGLMKKANSSSPLSLGLSIMTENAAQLLLLLNSSCEEQLLSVISLLLSASYEVQELCCTTLKDLLKSRQYSISFWAAIWDNIIHLVVETHMVPTVASMLVLSTEIFLTHPSAAKTLNQTQCQHLLLILQSPSSGSTLKAALLPAFSICLKSHIISTRLCSSYLTSWSEQFLDARKSVDETVRVSASQALFIVGSDLLHLDSETCELFVRCKCCDGWICLVSILQAAVSLLQDDSSEVRSWAAKFVHSLPLEQCLTKFESLHSNICIQVLFEYIVSSPRPVSTSYIKFLLKQLLPQHQLQSLMGKRNESGSWQLFTQEDNSCYAELPVIITLAHEALTKLVNSSSDVKREQLQLCLESLHESVTEDLRHLADVPKEKWKENPVFNVTNDCKVFPVVYGLVLTADLIVLALPAAAGGEGVLEVCKEIHQLSQVSYLHPQMKKFLDIIIKGQ